MTTFVLCYLVFIFFPVAGPYYKFPRPAAWFLDNAAARLVYETLATGQLIRRGVPELARRRHGGRPRSPPRRGSRRLGLALLMPTVLLDRRRGVLPDALWGGCADRPGGRDRGRLFALLPLSTSPEPTDGAEARKRHPGTEPARARNRGATVDYCTVILPCMPSARCGRQ